MERAEIEAALANSLRGPAKYHAEAIVTAIEQVRSLSRVDPFCSCGMPGWDICQVHTEASPTPGGLREGPDLSALRDVAANMHTEVEFAGSDLFRSPLILEWANAIDEVIKDYEAALAAPVAAVEEGVKHPSDCRCELCEKYAQPTPASAGLVSAVEVITEAYHKKQKHWHGDWRECDRRGSCKPVIDALTKLEKLEKDS